MTRELFNVVTPAVALERLLRELPVTFHAELIATVDALDRILAEDVVAPADLPAFCRSTMDGYAVGAESTFGASDAQPAYLAIVGEVAMGRKPERGVAGGECLRIATGGMLPTGADAVVMIERTERVDDGSIEVVRAVASGENTIAIGEDVKRGDVVLRAGDTLRPQDLGGLHAHGITRIGVARRFRVAILASGDEVVPPDATPADSQVRDVNSVTLASLVRRAGHDPIAHGIFADDRERLELAARAALDDADVVILAAGSSVSARDLTADVIDGLGSPGILVHGVALKPGKPTILALCDGKPVFGLPGNPVSCMVTFDLFVRPTLARMSGARAPLRRTLSASLTKNVPSKAGREDYVPARVVHEGTGALAEPIASKSNLIFSLVRADGLIRVPLDKTGLSAGETVEVVLF